MPAADFVEVALEESPVHENANTAVTPHRIASNKLYLPVRSARLSPAPGHLDRSDELRGIQGAPARLIEMYEPGGALSERIYFKDLTWLLTLAGFVGTHTAGDGVITDPDGVVIPAGAERWVFAKRDTIDAQTAQVRINHKREDVELKGNGYAISQLGLNAAGELTADLVGLVLKRLAADTTTVPAYPSQQIPPARRGELLLTWLANGGRPADFSLSIANPVERVRDISIDPPSHYPNALEHAAEQVAVTGSIPKRALDADDFDALLAATTFAAEARWKSSKSIGVTGYKYALWIEMPSCQYVAGEPEEHGNKRRVGASYDFFAAYDEVAGYDVKLTLVNDVAAIATYA
jgi:hypothetical protein